MFVKEHTSVIDIQINRSRYSEEQYSKTEPGQHFQSALVGDEENEEDPYINEFSPRRGAIFCFFFSFSLIILVPCGAKACPDYSAR